jgi:hypothetical protein
MTQAFDMKRLHMGCGESLQSQLPQQGFDKSRLSAGADGAPNRRAGTVAVPKKRQRSESR